MAGHRCIYAIDPRGVLHAGFLESRRVVRVDDPPPPSPEALVGEWVDGTCGGPSCGRGCPSDRIRVTRLARGGLHLTGAATRRCGEHLGAVAGALTVVDGRGEVRDEDGCVVRFVVRGPFLMVADNARCGGANVRFMGIWMRRGGRGYDAVTRAHDHALTVPSP